MTKQEFIEAMNQNIAKLGRLPIRADQATTIGVPVCEVINSLIETANAIVNTAEDVKPNEAPEQEDAADEESNDQEQDV